MPNDPCFDCKGPSFGGLNPKNRGQTGSRYTIYHVSGQISIIPKPEFVGDFGEIPLLNHHLR